ncbi:MAG TPA: Gfo/Idh/MocA family oxidoreductase [Gemmataceae bacterium]|nr:Gfo/Idh/MocA family oxidoreductase [Gemmataceae bacterium]
MTGIALVGIGNWGANWLRTLATLPEASLRWVCDLNADLLAKAKTDYPDVRPTSNLNDLIDDPETLGIVIASNAPTHFALAKRALEGGKDVMVEKPMALTTADAAELVRIADDNDRMLMVGHLLEYHPAIQSLRKLIDSSELGEIRRIESRRSNHGVLRTDENAWWSLAPHDLSMAVRLMGDWPISVACEGQNIVQSHIADVVGGTLRFPGGRMARIDVSWHDPAKVRELKIYGTKKWAVFNDMLPWDRKVIVYDRGFDVDSSGPKRRITARRGAEIALPLPNTEPLIAEARHFVECIRTRNRPVSDGRSGIGIVAILEAGQASLETGREVVLANPESTIGLRKAG